MPAVVWHAVAIPASALIQMMIFSGSCQFATRAGFSSGGIGPGCHFLRRSYADQRKWEGIGDLSPRGDGS
jgi:hypothetical protein